MSGLYHSQQLRNTKNVLFIITLLVVHVFFVLFSVQNVLADDETSKDDKKQQAELQKGIEETLEQYYKAKKILQDKDNYSEKDVQDAKTTIRQYRPFQIEILEKTLRDTGGDPDRIKREVETQREGTKKLDLDKLKKEDFNFSDSEWNEIEFYKGRIKNRQERLKEAGAPERYKERCRQDIEQFEKAIRGIVNQARKRNKITGPPGGKVRSKVDGNEKAIEVPKKIRPWKVRPRGLDIAIDGNDVQIIEDMTRRFYPNQWLDEMNKWLHKGTGPKIPLDLEKEYYQIQDNMRALLLIQKEQWSFDEAHDVDANLSRLCKRLVLTEKKILWLFGSHQFEMTEQDAKEFLNELALIRILKQANEDYSKVDDKLKENEKNLRELERLYNALRKHGTPVSATGGAALLLAHRKTQLLWMETLRERHSKLKQKQTLADTIVELRLKRGLRRAQAQGYRFKIHEELVAKRREYRTQGGGREDVADAKKATLRELMETSAEKANFDKQWTARNKALRNGYRQR